MSTDISARLRAATAKLRVSSMPLADMIPLMQEAADALDAQAWLAALEKDEGFAPVVDRESAIKLAKDCAFIWPQSYMGETAEDCIEKFEPHEWVIQAVMEAAKGLPSDRSERAEAALRQLAAYVGNGGFNAPFVDPEVFKAKIIDGIDRARPNPWKDRVIDALVVNWAYKKEHEGNPELALADLIKQETAFALDPSISGAAEALVQRGRDEVLARLQPERDKRDSI